MMPTAKGATVPRVATMLSPMLVKSPVTAASAVPSDAKQVVATDPSAKPVVPTTAGAKRFARLR